MKMKERTLASENAEIAGFDFAFPVGMTGFAGK